MNAYELADELQKLDAKLHLINLFKSADMLRQQADRIAELEKRVEEVKETNGKFVELIQMQREHAEELRKEILVWENAEVPVEVMTELIAELQRKGLIEKAQTKPLSDEEIEKVAKIHLGHSMGLLNWHGFARAIEERHGIKSKPLDEEEKKEIYMITPEMIGAALGLKPRRRIK